MTNLRYDHMSGHGYPRPTTPNLDALARESLVFERAFAHNSWTLPESMSLYTSLYPYQHGMMQRYAGGRLPADVPTLIDILNRHGYRTAAFTGGFDYNPRYGLTDRFAEYGECVDEAVKRGGRLLGFLVLGGHPYGRFECTIPQALDWLVRRDSQPFFLHVQAYDAHCPFLQATGALYDPGYAGTTDFSNCFRTLDRTDPVVKDGKRYYEVFGKKGPGGAPTVLLSEADVRHLVALYDESITLADRAIGAFLGMLRQKGLLEHTVVVFTSEHGDMLGKYGRFMRGGPIRGTFYDDVLHVPLMIRHPRLAPRHVEGLMEHVDVMPTLLEMLGIPTPPRIEGRSAVPLIMTDRPLHRYVFAGAEFLSHSNNPSFPKQTTSEAVRDARWKLIQETVLDEQDVASRTVEFYDVAQDPEELRDLARADDPAVRRALEALKATLAAWSARVRKRARP